MKAVRIHSYGSPDVMQVEDVETPHPQQGQVLIRVYAASVNPVDYKMRSGEIRAPGARMPMTLGRDISGVVQEAGTGVTDIRAGDEVMALLDADHGGYAEFVTVNAEDIARKPASLDHMHAAAVPLAAITAWQGLFDHGALKQGERVLIHGASGGVGHFAVQFARNRGAYVIATARGEDRSLVTDLGADEVIDYQTERFEERVHDVDLVLDLVAGPTQEKSWACLKTGGRLVSALQAPSKAEASRRNAIGVLFRAQPSRRTLQEISNLIDSGEVRVVMQQSLPLSEAWQAHEMLEHGHVRGKLVLDVAGIANTVNQYSFPQGFRVLYTRAVQAYAGGNGSATSVFTPEELAWLAGHGLTAQALYDYAEDEVKYQEPGIDIALGIEATRRNYFFIEQGGRKSGHTIRTEDLPAKTAELAGVARLPRIIAKAQAKLRGELPSDLMYGCGGDRKFLKSHDVPPDEFLSLVWQYKGDGEQIAAWLRRQAAVPGRARNRA